MRRNALRLLAAFLLAAFVCVRPSEAKIAHVSLKQLTRDADRIVIAHVTELRMDHGVRIATAVSERTYKGAKADQPLHFVAEPTWTCDSSTAIQGEAVLLFLKRVTGNKISLKGRAASVVSTHPLYQISDSGRGRMPVRTLNGQRYVTLWTRDMQLPRQIQTRPDPDHDRQSFIRAAPLSEITVRLSRP